MDADTEPEVVIDGGEPAVRQIELQIRRQILDGALRPGEELPSVRGLAVGLAVSPKVVEQAYATLERQGFLLAEDGCGPRVAAAPESAALEQLNNWCREFLCRATADGHTPAEVMRALHACIDGSSSHGEPR
jgi:DNA-binding transcriptional regulator YhcF (GntR family)